jgi:hypothetical protein
MADLVNIASFAQRSEALVACSLLLAEGVSALMPDFNVLTADLDPSFMQSGWRLMVREEDAALARRVLIEAKTAAALEARI